MSDKKTCIISVGGSLICPKSGVDWQFLKEFKRFIEHEVAQGRTLCLVVGGGETARTYQGALRDIGYVSSQDLDWIGIHATRLNAQLVRIVFGEKSYPEIITDPEASVYPAQKIIIASGWKPGWSTDFVAVTLAETHAVHSVVNLSNIDHVYDKDPKKHKDARAIKQMNWKDFRILVGSTWDPGMNAPFDPMASEKAEKLGLEVVIMNGKKLDNLKHYLDGDLFEGTKIVAG